MFLFLPRFVQLRIALGLSPETRSIRPYRGFREIGRMISRSAFTQLRYSIWLLLGTSFGLLLTYVAPPALALSGSLWGAAAWGLMIIALVPALRFYGVSVLWAPLLPVIAIVLSRRDDSFGRVALAGTRRPLERPDYVALLPEDDHDLGTYKLGNGTSDFITSLTRLTSSEGSKGLRRKCRSATSRP